MLHLHGSLQNYPRVLQRKASLAARSTHESSQPREVAFAFGRTTVRLRHAPLV